MLAEKRPAARGSDETALFAHGVWMGLGFVGSSLLAGGVATCFAAPGLSAALSIVAGTVLAIVSWRRAGAALSRVDASFAQ